MRAFTLCFIFTFLCFTVFAQTKGNDKTVKDKSIAEMKLAMDQEKNATKRFYLLSKIVREYASEEINKEVAQDAQTSAESLLQMTENYKTNWNYGNAIHHSHLVLGRVSLLNENIDESKKHLMSAAQTPGSPQLNSFGPNMTLAKELLERGEKVAVLAYLDECRRFWKSKNAPKKIAKWKADISKGKIPSFEGNLVY